MDGRHNISSGLASCRPPARIHLSAYSAIPGRWCPCVHALSVVLSVALSTGVHLILMNSMKLVIPLHSLYWSTHTKDESKRGTAFAFIVGVN